MNSVLPPQNKPKISVKLIKKTPTLAYVFCPLDTPENGELLYMSHIWFGKIGERVCFGLFFLIFFIILFPFFLYPFFIFCVFESVVLLNQTFALY